MIPLRLALGLVACALLPAVAVAALIAAAADAARQLIEEGQRP